MPDVILVDEHDKPLGQCEKLSAHQQGLLHRAFSVCIFRAGDTGRELLLQQRQQDKYHCGGLWTNTCCSHPSPGEDTIKAGERRLEEEMGFSTPLTKVGHFTYRSEFDNGLIEHELDHVLVGEYNGPTHLFNRNEVMAVRWCPLTDIKKELLKYPERFTPWFEKALILA